MKICFVRNYIYDELLNQTKFDSLDDIKYVNGNNGLYGKKLLEKLFINDKIQNEYDYVVLVDEDCKILNMVIVYNIINHMNENNVDIIGMPDGGDFAKYRDHREDVPNLFFTIFKTEKIKKFNSDEYCKWDSPLYSTKPQSSNFEPYYKTLTYLIYSLNCNFEKLKGEFSKIDNISTELYYNNKIFCVHTWYTRLYKTDNKHHERINKVLSSYDKKLTIAIVGNSPSLLNHEWGKEIDSHDIVIRFNNFVLDGCEKQLGEKYTHIMDVLIGASDQGRKTYVNVDKLLNIPKENRLIRDNRNFDLYEVMDKKLTRNDVTFVDNRINEGMKKKIPTRDYSSGMIAIQMFVDKYPKADIDVYGFSFLKDKKTHAYDNVQCSWEEPNKEELYFNTYLKNKVTLHK